MAPLLERVWLTLIMLLTQCFFFIFTNTSTAVRAKQSHLLIRVTTCSLMMIVVRGDVKQLAPKAFGKQLFKKWHLQRHQQLILTSVTLKSIQQLHPKLLINRNIACPELCLINEATHYTGRGVKWKNWQVRCVSSHGLPCKTIRSIKNPAGQVRKQDQLIGLNPTLRRDSSSKCHSLNQHRETPQRLVLLILTSYI